MSTPEGPGTGGSFIRKYLSQCYFEPKITANNIPLAWDLDSELYFVAFDVRE